MTAPATTTTHLRLQLPPSTTTLISSSAAAAAAATHASHPPDPSLNGECRLLGPFSLFVQLALGALALLSLVYKRYRERPQRPLKIWTFDVSKQVFGSCMLHLANVVLSMFSAGRFEIQQTYQPNPCSYYLLNLGIDTTLGIPILYFSLLVIHRLAYYTPLAQPPESIESGHYGQPPRILWWFKQSVLYFMGLLWMKFCVFVLIQVFPLIVRIGDWALRWTEGNTALQIIFVMLLFPLIMNAIQYYIVDAFIKKQDVVVVVEVAPFDDESRHDSRSVHGALLEASSSGDTGDAGLGDRTAAKDAKPLSRNQSSVRVATTEYDPLVDGTDDPPESSSRIML